MYLIRPDTYRLLFKRWLDLAGIFLIGFPVIPVMLAVALFVYLALGRPVIFRQERPGLGGRPFVLYKFRTMTNERRPDGTLRSKADRITRSGRWLRRTSLDELPGLWNVLRGEMSLVGPRPLLPRYLERYTPEQSRRHEVKPGLTGWAQVNGRNAIGWDDRFRMDVWYVDHRCLSLDLKIILRTIPAVLSGRGIDAAGQTVGVAEFAGSLSHTPQNSTRCKP